MKFSADEETAQKLVNEALGFFKAACDAENQIGDLASGLARLTSAHRLHNQLCELVPGIETTVGTIFDCLLKSISSLLCARVSEERLYMSLGAAAGLLTRPDDGFHADRQLFVDLLVADICATLLVTAIEARGNPLGKIVATCVALNAPALTSTVQ